MSTTTIEMVNCEYRDQTTSAIRSIDTTVAATSKTASSGFDAYPVPFKDQLTVKYKFDYKSDVEVKLFNTFRSISISFQNRHGYMNKEVTLDLKLNRKSDKSYIVKLTTDKRNKYKKSCVFQIIS
jgi:hypothetical protein